MKDDIPDLIAGALGVSRGTAYDMMREALAQPEQEPVAWRTFDGEGGYDYRTYEENENYAEEWDKRNPKHKDWVEPLYTTPPQRKPLTVQEIAEFVGTHEYGSEQLKWFRFGEASHGITKE